MYLYMYVINWFENDDFFYISLKINKFYVSVRFSESVILSIVTWSRDNFC